jgi:hypothetical protein
VIEVRLTSKQFEEFDPEKSFKCFRNTEGFYINSLHFDICPGTFKPEFYTCEGITWNKIEESF